MSYKKNRKGSIAWHLEQHELQEERLIAKHAQERAHYAKVVAEHLARNRQNEQKILDDAFKITELENQVAVQWKTLAEAKDDVRIATHNLDVWRQRAALHAKERDDLATTLGRLRKALEPQDGAA